MTKISAALVSFTIWLALAGAGALAQSNPSPAFYPGYVPTAAQWNSYFAQKQDYLGFTPVSPNGVTMTGRFKAAAPTSTLSGFSITPGGTPSAPANGDVWVTTVGVFARVNGVTQRLDSADGVTSVFGRTGAVTAQTGDYNFSQLSGNWTLAQGPTLTADNVLGALVNGVPVQMPLTACDGANEALNYTAGTGFSCQTIAGTGVTSVFGRTGAVTAQSGDYSVAQVSGAAPIADPTFTGVATSPVFTGTTTEGNIIYGLLPSGSLVNNRWGVGVDGTSTGSLGWYNDGSSGSLDGTSTPTYNAETFYAKMLLQNDGSLLLGNSLRLKTGGYLNFSSPIGSSGYGIRDDGAGAVQVKNSGGSWNNILYNGSALNASNLSTGTVATARGGVGRDASGDANKTVSVANGSGGTAAMTATTWFDTAYCNTVGYLIVRLTGSWSCAQGMPINVTWFGAVGNGSTDNSTTIQGILNTLQAANGGAVYFPPGVFCVNSGLSWTTTNKSVRLIGAGTFSSVISACGGNTADTIYLNGAWSTLEQMFVNGKGIGDTATFGASHDAVSLGPSCVSCAVEHSYLIGGQYALHLQTADVRVNDTYAASSYGTGSVYIHGSAGVQAAGIRFRGTSFDQSMPVTDNVTAPLTIAARANSTAYSVGDVVSLSGYKLQASVAGTSGASPPALKNYNQPITDGGVTWYLAGAVNYAGLYIQSGASEVYLYGGCDISGAAHDYGIRIRNDLVYSGSSAPYIIKVRDCILGTNLTSGISAEAGNDLYVSGGEVLGCKTATCDLITVGANWTGQVYIGDGVKISGAQRAGVALIGNGSALNATITGNIITGNTSFGVLVTANASDFIIANNVIKTSGTPVSVQAGTSNYYSIVNNNLHGVAIFDGGTGVNKTVTPNN